MPDRIQLVAQALAYSSPIANVVAVGCAQALLLAVVTGWLAALWRNRRTLTRANVLHILLLLGASFIVATILGHFVIDPRPYLTEHIQPLSHVSSDNGFPSDHVLLAATLTASLWWIDRRLVGVFALATLLVMFGRLGIAAHHTLDVGGSTLIALSCAFIVGLVPTPQALSRPLLRNAGPGAL